VETPPRRWEQITAVAVGGALGTLARAALAATGHGLLPIMVANIAGTLVLAVLTSALLTGGGRGRRLLALAAGTGMCGALTTYSGLVLEVLRLTAPASAAQLLVPLLLLSACLLAGLLTAVAGWALGSLLRDGRAQ
jgi:CrcB protein